MRKTISILCALALVLSFSLVAATPVTAAPPVTSGLVLHLDAGDAGSVTRDGANRVSQWADLSGIGNHATQVDPGKRPTYKTDILNGKPVIRFDGAYDYLAVPDDSRLEPSDTNLFMIAVPAAWTATASCFLAKRTAFGNGYMLIQVESTGALWFDWGGSSGANRWVTTYAPALDTAGIMNMSRDISGRYLYIDGELEDVTATSGNSGLVPTSSDLVIGRDSLADQYHFNGDIAEILIYNRTLSDAERQEVEQYLGRKWLGWGSACIETATGSGTACLTTSHGIMSDLVAVAAPSLPSVTFPHGMFNFKITGLTPGQTVTLTIELPDPVPVGTVWWKYDNGRWHSLPNLNDNGNNIMVIQVKDGGVGDSDGVANGIIVDPGGPGNPMTVGWDTAPVSMASVLAPWIALLAVIMVGAGLLVWRRLAAES